MAYRKGNPRHSKNVVSKPVQSESASAQTGADKHSAAGGNNDLPIVQFRPFAPSEELLGEYNSTHRKTGSSNPRLQARRKSSEGQSAESGIGGQAETTFERFRTPASASASNDKPHVRRDRAEYANARKKRKKKKIIIGSIACSVILILGLAAAAFAYIYKVNGNIQRGLGQDLLGALSIVDSPEDPFYALLLGIDGSLEREATMGSNFRSDSMMLARIDPKADKVTLVSIPRDLKMDMGEYGTQKINAAHAFGGPALAVKTVSQLAGVPISHYAEINFDGFKAAVDSLGGIEVDVPIAINDPQAGGSLEAGVQTLDGNGALILCRSRHSYDKYGSGDDYRAANQRMVLSAIAQKLLASDALTIANSISAMSEYILTDMDVTQIVSVAQSMSGLSTDNIYTGKAPATSEYSGGAWWDILDLDGWVEMMERVDAGLPPTEEDIIDESTGTIMSTAGGSVMADSLTNIHASDRTTSIGLRNGNGSDGICENAQKELEAMGYKKINSRNADNFDYDKTVVVYKTTSDKKDAELIAQQLGVDAPISDRDVYLFDEDVLVVLGKDYSASQ